MFQLSIAALVFAALFAGAALYISLVEHPARVGLADGPLLMQWQPSYKRALPIQSGLAVASGSERLRFFTRAKAQSDTSGFARPKPIGA